LAVEQDKRVLVACDPEPPHVDLPVLAAGIVPRHDACLSREQFRQRLRRALGNLPGSDHRHADRCFEAAFWKTRRGHNDGWFFRTLSKRARRRGRDERGNDGSFQGFLPRHASPQADFSLREEMR